MNPNADVKNAIVITMDAIVTLIIAVIMAIARIILMQIVVPIIVLDAALAHGLPIAILLRAHNVA